MGKDVIIPPMVFIGELFPWKGKFWKVQLYDQAGGMIQLDGETTGGAKAISQNPIMVLEMQGDTTGETKRRKHGTSRVEGS